MCSRNRWRFSRPCAQLLNVSSTYLNQNPGFNVEVAKAFFSNSKNRSARNLTPVEEDFLALGLSFAVVPRVLPKEEIVQRLEPKLFHLKNDVASNICVQITEVLRRARLPRSNLTKNMKDAVRNLRADKSIYIF